MTKTINQGGQRRTIQLGCGYTTKGSVKECEFKMKLHSKRCSLCVGNHKSKEFDNSMALHNGWNGLKGSNRVTSVVTYTNSKDSYCIINTNNKEKALKISRIES